MTQPVWHEKCARCGAVLAIVTEMGKRHDAFHDAVAGWLDSERRRN